MSEHFEIFPYVWLGVVAVIGAFSLAKGVYEFRTGEARARWFGGFSEPMSKGDQPFYYWLIVFGDFFGFAMTCFMFWMGLDFLKW